MSPADGAATLTWFTCAAVARAERHLPEPPSRWLVTGGGRHNPVMMERLNKVLTGPVEPVEAVGWDGDALEAQAFAHLAVRSLDGLPLTIPSTTGVSMTPSPPSEITVAVGANAVVPPMISWISSMPNPDWEIPSGPVLIN